MSFVYFKEKDKRSISSGRPEGVKVGPKYTGRGGPSSAKINADLGSFCNMLFKTPGDERYGMRFGNSCV